MVNSKIINKSQVYFFAISMNVFVSHLEQNPCDIPNVCHENAICSSEGDIARCTCIPPLKGDGKLKCERKYDRTLGVIRNVPN